jgi:hypothetical protein
MALSASAAARPHSIACCDCHCGRVGRPLGRCEAERARDAKTGPSGADHTEDAVAALLLPLASLTKPTINAVPVSLRSRVASRVEDRETCVILRQIGEG